MRITCVLCGQIIQADNVRTFPEGMPAEQAAEMHAVQEFDLVAARMGVHLDESHPIHAQEKVAVMYLAGKAYAMNYASWPEELTIVRNQWRGSISIAMSTAVHFEAPAGSPAAGGDGSAASSADPASNVKNESRKASN